MSAKKGGQQGGTAGKAAADPATVEGNNKLTALKSQAKALQAKIMVTSQQLQRSRLESLNLKKRIADINEKFEKEEKMCNDMCSEMYAQYRYSQKQLLARIESHQSAIEDLRCALDDARKNLERTKAEKDEEIAAKTKSINEQKMRMDQLAVAFGQNLKTILEGMSQSIHGRADDK